MIDIKIFPVEQVIKEFKVVVVKGVLIVIAILYADLQITYLPLFRSGRPCNLLGRSIASIENRPNNAPQLWF